MPWGTGDIFKTSDFSNQSNMKQRIVACCHFMKRQNQQISAFFLVNVLYYQQIICITTINFLLIRKYINWLISEMKMATVQCIHWLESNKSYNHFCLFKYCIIKQWWIHETGIQHEVCSTYSSEQCYYTAQRLPPAVWTTNLYILYE